MRMSHRINAMLCSLSLILALFVILAAAQFAPAQAPEAKQGPQPKMPLQIKPDPRVQQRSYHLKEADKDMTYVLYVSSKVSKDKKNPLIIALHGMGGDGNFLVRDRLVDLAEEGAYIVAGPLGYNVTGWYGSPVIQFPKSKDSKELAPIEPPNLRELSEKDVMTVLDMMRKEFNVDNDRTYLLGHSMGGAGTLFLGAKYTSNWAAIASIAPAAFMMLDGRKEYLGKINNANIPVILVQGDKDPAVPVTYTRQWADTMKEIGMKHKYIEFPGGDHGTGINDGMPDIFKFFAEHPKAAVQ
jgi:predicted peptidase